MNRKLLTLLAIVVMIGATDALAQSASDTITVTATNAGIFTFAIDQASFDFGTVDANGTTSSTGVGGVRGGAGALYTALSAATWTCNSAPKRTVNIAEASLTHTGGIPAGQLAIQVPAVSGGTSLNYVAFGAGTDLITGIANVGNGANAVSGTIDFQLTVNDVDAVGANSWTVVLTASGV